MSKFATKAAANMFCQARYEAAKSNERLSSREGAAEEIGIDRTRLARIELGSTIPYQEEVLLMDSFNDAIEVGAAAGDTSATWQNYANQIWKNGSDELKASLTDPSNPMYETVRSQLPPELAEAIDRAAAETTTDDVTLEGLKASVDGDVDIDKDAWTSKLNEALGDFNKCWVLYRNIRYA